MTRWLAPLLAAVVLLSACGVPTEDSADLADDGEVPFGLLDRDREPVTGANPSGRGVEIFLYDDDTDTLSPVIRRVEDDSLSAVISQLEQDLSEEETMADVRNPLAGVDAVATVENDGGGVVTIDLSEEFSDIRRSDQLIAIAQLVFTSTARPGVGQVSFTLEGARVEIPRGDGSLTTGNVTRQDYATLAPGA